MSLTEYVPLMIIGAVFLLVGIILLILGNREEKDYCRTVSNQTDVRKYLEYRTDSIQAWGFKVGGIIAVVIGLFLLVMGFVIWVLR